MEKETIAIVGALAGATVATAAALVVRRIEVAQTNREHHAELLRETNDSYRQGWLHGRNKKLQEETGEREVFSDPRAA